MAERSHDSEEEPGITETTPSSCANIIAIQDERIKSRLNGVAWGRVEGLTGCRGLTRVTDELGASSRHP
jgi:hypothetical protein